MHQVKDGEISSSPASIRQQDGIAEGPCWATEKVTHKPRSGFKDFCQQEELKVWYVLRTFIRELCGGEILCSCWGVCLHQAVIFVPS